MTFDQMWGQRTQPDRTIRRIESITSLEDSQRKGSLMSESVVQLSENTFDEEISSATEPILVDFWAEWCGPCKMIAPVLDQIAAERSNLTIAKVNTDVNPVTPGRFGVRGIPFLVLFHNGKPVDQKTGAMPKPGFDQWLNTHMG